MTTAIYKHGPCKDNLVKHQPPGPHRLASANKLIPTTKKTNHKESHKQLNALCFFSKEYHTYSYKPFEALVAFIK
jgi:hypothetical protein